MRRREYSFLARPTVKKAPGKSDASPAKKLTSSSAGASRSLVAHGKFRPRARPNFRLPGV